MGLLQIFAQTADPTTTSYTVTTISPSTSSSVFGVYFFVYLIIGILSVVALWKVFSKANEAGWQAIIPIWNTLILLKIVGRPMWWILLLFVPLVNIVIIIIVMLDLGKSFAKSTVFSIFGLIIFSIVGLFILGFGDAKYVGPAGAGTTSAAPPTV